MIYNFKNMRLVVVLKWINKYYLKKIFCLYIKMYLFVDYVKK